MAERTLPTKEMLGYDPELAIKKLDEIGREVEYLDRHTGELMEIYEQAEREASRERRRHRDLYDRLVQDGVIEEPDELV